MALVLLPILTAFAVWTPKKTHSTSVPSVLALTLSREWCCLSVPRLPSILVALSQLPLLFGLLAPYHGTNVALVHTYDDILGPFPCSVPLVLLLQHFLNDGLTFPNDVGQFHLWWQLIEHSVKLSQEFLQ